MFRTKHFLANTTAPHNAGVCRSREFEPIRGVRRNHNFLSFNRLDVLADDLEEFWLSLIDVDVVVEGETDEIGIRGCGLRRNGVEDLDLFYIVGIVYRPDSNVYEDVTGGLVLGEVLSIDGVGKSHCLEMEGRQLNVAHHTLYANH